MSTFFKVSVLAAVLVLALFLLGCTQPQTAGTVTNYVCPDGRTVVTDITKCPSTGTAGAAAPPAEKSALEKELEICVGMPYTQSIAFEDFCIAGIAGKYKDASPCKKLGKDERTGCYAIVAEVKEDPDVCVEAGPQMNQCYEYYARDKMDVSVCGKIKDVSYRDQCYNNMVNQLSDPTLCEEIQTIGMKDSCYFSIAMRMGDSSYCEKITNSDQKQSCQQNLQGRKVPG